MSGADQKHRDHRGEQTRPSADREQPHPSRCRLSTGVVFHDDKDCAFIADHRPFEHRKSAASPVRMRNQSLISGRFHLRAIRGSFSICKGCSSCAPATTRCSQIARAALAFPPSGVARRHSCGLIRGPISARCFQCCAVLAGKEVRSSMRSPPRWRQRRPNRTAESAAVSRDQIPHFAKSSRHSSSNQALARRGRDCGCRGGWNGA